MTLFRRPSTISCFYCLSAIDLHSVSSSMAKPFDSSSFRCPLCACWNRYDSRGQILGDEPAMHDERLNVDSFSRRGLPDRNHLPSLSSSKSSPFCRTCETNQSLLINLRAAYLPDPKDPSYSMRLAQLPSYIASLQARYPPVCPSCQPTVDAEITRKNEFARMRALAGAIKATSRPSSRTEFTPSNDAKPKLFSLRIWRIRGGFWAASCITALLLDAAGALNIDLPSYLRRLTPLLPFIILASASWTFWDPTYSLQRKSQTQGKRVRIEGRERFILLQSLAWSSRLASSVLLFCSWARLDWDFLHLRAPSSSDDSKRRQVYFAAALILELSVLLFSYLAITIHRPIPIRLIDTSVQRTLSQPNVQANNVQPEPDLFSMLSLSSDPVLTAPADPKFGQASLAPGHSSENAVSNINGSAQSAFPEDDDYEEDSVLRHTTNTQKRDPDSMDWEPSSPYKSAQSSGKQAHDSDGGCPPRDDGTWLRQQRFFPPEEPTGLESLLMRTQIVDEDDAAARRQPRSSARRMEAPWAWGLVYGASVLPVVAILAALWLRSRS